MRWTTGTLAVSVALVGLIGQAQAQHREWHAGPHPYREHDIERWHHGSWWRGWHEGREGWWWIVGGVWYWYPAPVYPYPDPYRPPVAVAPPGGQFYYYCPNPPGYYPAVPACPSPWQMVPAAPPPQAVPVQPMPAPPPMGPTGQVMPSPGIDKTTGGTVIGAVGGAVAGAQFGHGTGKLAATAAGTLLGAFLGHEVGQSLDRADVVAANNAELSARQAPMGQSIAWNNPGNGHSGTIIPVRDGTDSSGNYCREFQQNIVVAGQAAAAYGTSCRQPDGSWKIVQR